MRSSRIVLCVSLLALCLFVADESSGAAPVPAATRLSNKYLLDETFSIAVVNPRLVLDSPLFAKNYDMMVSGHLKEEPVASILAAASFNPRKDVDFIFLIMDVGTFRSEANKPGGGGPTVLFQGRFDVKALETAIEKINSLHGDAVKPHVRGDAKLYEISGARMWAAILDKENVMVSGTKATIEAALDKAAGKTTTTFKNKAFGEIFGKIKGDHALTVAATSDMIYSAHYSTDATGRFEAKFDTLSQVGIETILGTADVTDTIKVSTSVTSKDADAATKLNKTWTDGLQTAASMVEKQPGFGPLATAMRAIKVESKGIAVTIDTTAEADVVQSFFKAMFGLRAEGPPPAVEP